MKFYKISGWNYIDEADDGHYALRADAEQLEKERDEFERKCGELCQAHGTLLIKFHDAAKDAVEMARLAQREIIRRCSGKIEWVYEDDPGIQLPQTVIERYEGGKG